MAVRVTSLVSPLRGTSILESLLREFPLYVAVMPRSVTVFGGV